MREQLLQLKDFSEGAELALIPEATDQRDALLVDAEAIREVIDPLTADLVVETMQGIAELLRKIEAARKEIKAPVITLGKKIDRTAKDFVSDLERQKERLRKLLGAYEAAERTKREKEAEEARRKAREAEMRAQAAELSAKTDDEAATARAEGILAIAQARQEAASLKGPTVQGLRLVTAWKFRVVDINALYAARPELCELMPKTAAINQVIKGGAQLPGLEVWKESNASV